MAFESPQAALFFNHNPSKFIAACARIFIADMSTQSTQQIIDTPQVAYYQPHALALSNDDTMLVACTWSFPYSVCGYDTASRTRLWIYNTANGVAAVCMLGARVLVTVARSPTWVLDLTTGAQIATLQRAEGPILGLGVIEGLCFNLFGISSPLRPPHLRVPRRAAAPPLQASQASASAA